MSFYYKEISNIFVVKIAALAIQEILWLKT